MLLSKGENCLHFLVILSLCIKSIFSCGVHVCLTWEAKKDSITFKCKVSNLVWEVGFINHEREKQGYCLFPIPVRTCFSSHNVISQDLQTNTTVLVIQKHVDRRLNGPWKCYHGTNHDSAIVNVTVLKKDVKSISKLLIIIEDKPLKTIFENDNCVEQYMAWTFVGVIVGVCIVLIKRTVFKMSKLKLPSRGCKRDNICRSCCIYDTKYFYVAKLVIGISSIVCVIFIPIVIGQEGGGCKNKEYFIIFGVCMVLIFVTCFSIPKEGDPNDLLTNCEEPSRQQLSSDPNDPLTNCEEPSRQQLSSDQNEPQAEYEEPSRQQLLNVEVHQPTELEAETKQNNI